MTLIIEPAIDKHMGTVSMCQPSHPEAVHFRGWFSYKGGLGFVDRLSSRDSSQEYAIFLATNLLPNVKDRYGNNICVVIDDTDVNVRGVLQDAALIYLPWPRAISDINPMSDLWRIIGEHLHEDNVWGNEQLAARVIIQWARLMWRDEMFKQLALYVPVKLSRM